MISHADWVINVLASLVKTTNSMTSSNVTGAKKNGVNMKDLQILAEAAGRITLQQPNIAEQPATTQTTQPIKSANQNPHMQTNIHPIIVRLQHSPRLNKLGNPRTRQLRN